jgi:hypothetical protein
MAGLQRSVMIAGYTPPGPELPRQDWAVCSKVLHLVRPLEISFHGRDKNEASAVADANSYFHAAFGHWFIRMNSIGFDCRRMLPVKRGQKLRWCPEVVYCASQIQLLTRLHASDRQGRGD